LSKTDNIFINNCIEILDNGISDEDQVVRPRWDDGNPAHTIKTFGMINRYDLSKEFPILTLRKINFKACIDEILWIWQKKSNNIKDLNSHIWDAWADNDGTIGKAYGYQLSVKHKYPDGMFDQVDRILLDLKNNPYSRRIIANLYNPHDLSEMHLYPCVYSLLLNVTGNKLNAVLTQRSQDMIVANGWNVCQYAILVHMFAQASGLKVGELIHVVADAHIYDRHIDIAKEILNNSYYDAPKLIIDPNITNFYDFTVESFKLENYQYCEKKYKIPVAV
jgi:thymidylate synthase